MKKSTIVGIACATFSFTSFADETTLNLDETIVTGSRFYEINSPSTNTIRIISKEEIQNSPAISIPDVLQMQAGISITSLYGNQGIDSTVDLRGFGDAAISNTLILLDGQRLNSVDASNIQWASIPLEAIDHIEILSGGGSVLYGDRASGGVINLITDKSGKSATSITTSVGSYGYKSLDGFVSGTKGDIYYNAFVHTADENGWRNNSASNQWTLSGRIGNCFNSGEAFLDYSLYQVANGLPSSQSSIMYEMNPRLTRTPYDTQERDGFRLRPGLSIKLSNNLEFASEFAIAREHQHFDDISFSSISDHHLDTYSFTPRLKWDHGIVGMKSNSVIGIDYYYGQIDGDYHDTYANQFAKQISEAVYVQNNTAVSQSLDFSLGLRSQQMRQRAIQSAYLPYGYPEITGYSKDTRTVYDLGLRYHQDDWSVYGKLDSSFRFANTDELFGLDPVTFLPFFSGNIIKPQTAINQEMGVTFKRNGVNAKLAVYRTDVKDEIGYDSNLGINTNLSPTRHQGIEAELGWNILQDLSAKITYAYTDASFRDGPYKGNDLPSVPSNSAHSQLLWDGHGFGRYLAQINYTGQRYTAGDFANSLDKLPGYTTMDVKANWEIKPVTLSISILNLTDKKYSPYGLFSSYYNDYYYFPANARTFYLSARYDFK